MVGGATHEGSCYSARGAYVSGEVGVELGYAAVGVGWCYDDS
jgi:hypothetical protein